MLAALCLFSIISNMGAKEGNQTIDIRSAIRSRLSVRHYKGRPVPTNILEQVITFGGETIALDSSIPVLFHLVKGR
jgi:hypothetical protein